MQIYHLKIIGKINIRLKKQKCDKNEKLLFQNIYFDFNYNTNEHQSNAIEMLKTSSDSINMKPTLKLHL